MAVFAAGDAGQCRKGFALRSRGEDDGLRRVQFREAEGFAIDVVRALDKPEFHGLLDIGGKAAPAHQNTAAVFLRQFDNGLDAADMAGEQGDDDAPLGFAEDEVEVVAHLAFRLGAPLVLHVGRVGHEQAHAAVLGKACEIGAGIVGVFSQRSRVELEVPGVDDLAHGRFHGKGVALRYGVVNRDEVEGQAAQRHRGVGRHGDELHAFQHAMLFELVPDEGQREGRTVDAKAAQALILVEKPGQGADMVFMAMREDDAQHLFFFREHGFQTGDDHVDAEERIIREHEAAVDQHHALIGLPFLAVHADLAVASQRCYGQIGFRHIQSFLFSSGQLYLMPG